MSRRSPITRVRTPALAFAFLVLAVGCESGPSGPGALDARVESLTSSFGAAVVEVQGPGIAGFDGAGTTQVFWSATSQPDNFRVVLVSPEGSNTLAFRIRVGDLGGPIPGGTVIEAADLLNDPVARLTDFAVVVHAPS